MARPKKNFNITWLGEDHLHEEGGGPGKNVWRISGDETIVFPKGVPVAVSNPHVIEKAKANPFFEVEGFSNEEAE
jgi:hypothetical protein